MDILAQEDHSYCPSSEEYERYKKNWYISLNKSGRHAPVKNDLNQSLFINTKGGIRLLLLPVPHGGSGMKAGGAHFFFLKKKTKTVVARSFTADGNLLLPTGV